MFHFAKCKFYKSIPIKNNPEISRFTVYYFAKQNLSLPFRFKTLLTTSFIVLNSFNCVTVCQTTCHIYFGKLMSNELYLADINLSSAKYCQYLTNI